MSQQYDPRYGGEKLKTGSGTWLSSQLLLPIFIVLVVIVIILGFLVVRLSFWPNSSPVVISPTPTKVVPTPTPAPTPTPTVLCQANWSSGMDGWNGTHDWKAQNGVMYNDGTNGTFTGFPATLNAPCDLSQTPNYKVEAKVQLQSQGTDPGFGFYVRYKESLKSGYMVGDTDGNGACTTVCQLDIALAPDFSTPIQSSKFNPGTAMHTYTIEVNANQITIFIDGTQIQVKNDNRYLEGGGIGLWDKDVQATITSFKVLPL